MSKNAILFDDKNKAAEITHNQLAQTMELGDKFGDLPKQVPFQPGVLIQNIVEDVKKYAGLEATVAPIVVRETYCQTNRAKIKKNEPLDYEDYLIKRFVTKINLPMEAYNDTEDHLNASIALTYIFTDSAKGIQIGFGENVHVCDNLTIFGGFHFSTYGGGKVNFDEGMQLMHHWLQNLLTLHNKHIAIIDKLKEAKVARQGFHRILGSLFEKAVRRNTGEDIVAPINQTQIADMVRRGANILSGDKETLTGWEILNWGTSILKPHNSDMIDLLPDTAAFNTFLCNEFKIPMDLTI